MLEKSTHISLFYLFYFYKKPCGILEHLNVLMFSYLHFDNPTFAIPNISMGLVGRLNALHCSTNLRTLLC